MAIEQKRKEINGTVYLINQMSGLKALKTQTKMLALLGPNIGHIAGIMGKGGFTMENIAPVLGELMSSLDADKLYEFVVSLFDNGIFVEHTKGDVVVPVPVAVDTYFSGKPTEIWQVVGAILEVNFNQGN